MNQTLWWWPGLNGCMWSKKPRVLSWGKWEKPLFMSCKSLSSIDEAVRYPGSSDTVLLPSVALHCNKEPCLISLWEDEPQQGTWIFNMWEHTHTHTHRGEVCDYISGGNQTKKNNTQFMREFFAQREQCDVTGHERGALIWMMSAIPFIQQHYIIFTRIGHCIKLVDAFDLSVLFMRLFCEMADVAKLVLTQTYTVILPLCNW